MILRKTLTIPVLLAGCGLALGSGCSQGLRTGAMAPDFTLKNLTGQDFTLSSYRGNVVLLSYWAAG